MVVAAGVTAWVAVQVALLFLTGAQATYVVQIAFNLVLIELAAMKAEHDPLASHIFISRRHYRNANDTKSRKAPRDERMAEFRQSL